MDIILLDSNSYIAVCVHGIWYTYIRCGISAACPQLERYQQGLPPNEAKYEGFTHGKMGSPRVSLNEAK